MERTRLVLVLAYAFVSASLLIACGGGGGGGSAAVPSTASAGTGGAASGSGSAPSGPGAATTFSVTLQQYAPVVTSATQRRPAYISPDTASIAFTVKSVNGVTTSGSPAAFAVGSTAPNCSATNGVVNCTFDTTIPIGNDVLQAQTLDTHGNVLGTSLVTATVAANATNRIPLAIGGQIASLQLYLSQTQFTPGSAASALVVVVPLDPSGAQIVNPGPYNPPISVTLTSNSAGSHLSLIDDGANSGQSATLNSPNDQVALSYDGVGTSGSTNVTASAGSGITATANAHINTAPGLSVTPSGSQLVSSSTSFIFTTAGQTGALAASGGTPPYTATSSTPAVVTVGGSSPSFTLTSVGYGTSGSATITVSDSAGALRTIPVTFIAPAIALSVSSCGGGSTCTATASQGSVSFPAPANGTPSVPPTTIAASGGTGTYSFAFASSGTTSSPYAAIAQSGNTFTITPNGAGNDALLILSGNQTAYFAISSSAGGAAYAIGSTFRAYAPTSTSLTIAQGGQATVTLSSTNGPWTITDTCAGIATLTASNGAEIVAGTATGGTCTVTFTPAIGTPPAPLSISAIPLLSATPVAIVLHAIGDTFSTTISNGSPGGLALGAASIVESSGGSVISLSSYNAATGVLSGTATGVGASRISIHDINLDERIGIAVSVDDGFAASLPSAIGMVSGKPYTALVGSTLTISSGGSSPGINAFSVTAGAPATLSASPTSAGHGTITFNDTDGGSASVPYTVFGLAFATYPGSAISASADEGFSGSGEADTVTVSGLSGTLSAQSSNPNVVTTSVSGNTITVTSVGNGVATVTITDGGTGASATFSASVTTTTIPVSSIHRRP